jgi:hypothetical protein
MKDFKKNLIEELKKNKSIIAADDYSIVGMSYITNDKGVLVYVYYFNDDDYSLDESSFSYFENEDKAADEVIRLFKEEFMTEDFDEIEIESRNDMEND